MYPDLGVQTKSLKIAICPIFHSPGWVWASNQDKVIYVMFGDLGNNRSFVWIIKEKVMHAKFSELSNNRSCGSLIMTHYHGWGKKVSGISKIYSIEPGFWVLIAKFSTIKNDIISNLTQASRSNDYLSQTFFFFFWYERKFKRTSGIPNTKLWYPEAGRH